MTFLDDKKSEKFTETIVYGSGIQCLRKYENTVLSKEIWLKDEIIHRDGDEPAISYYFTHGLVSKSLYWYKNGKIHRENDKPARIDYFRNGSKEREVWFINDLLYRADNRPCEIRYSSESNVLSKYRNPRKDGEPTEIHYYESGNKKREKWWNTNYSSLREDDKPSVVEYYDSFDENGIQRIKAMNWFRDHFLSREDDKPSRIRYYENGNIMHEEWYRNGKRHRDNSQPAVIDYSMNEDIIYEEWFIEGDIQKPPED